MSDCTSKREYRRAFAIKTRGEGTPVNAVAEQLAVSRQSVSKWTAAFMKKGAGGIRAAKRKKRLSDARLRATARIRDVLHSEHVESGYLKGRWCIADIASLLNREGVAVSRSTVARTLCTMKYVWKRPKLRAPGSILRDYRKRKEVANHRKIAPALRKKGILVLCEDEKWIELHPGLEGKWMENGSEEFVAAPGYTARWNYFISLDVVTGRIIWNSFPGRRNREFRLHLRNILTHAKRIGMKKVILFVDMASCHGTPEVREMLKEHPEIEMRRLQEMDKNMNPVELLVNRKMSSFVQCNRCYYNTDDLREAGNAFLGRYNGVCA